MCVSVSVYVCVCALISLRMFLPFIERAKISTLDVQKAIRSCHVVMLFASHIGNGWASAVLVQGLLLFVDMIRCDL